ncbi:MAG: MBL fold metallo-hydrolase [Myxococcota bacterium]
MVRIRAVVSLLMMVALVLGLGVLSLAGQVWWSLPSPQGRLVRGPHELVGVYAGRSYSWIVPTDDPRGVVLVDVGSERAATRIEAELRKGQREVRAILLTHAHGDQVTGLEAFPDVPVYLSADERPLLAGEVEPEGWLSRFYAADIALPSDLQLVEPDQTVDIGGAVFVAIPTPGHTAGSVTWWWRDVVFTGGALLAASPPAISPSGLNDDDDEALKSVEALLPLDFDVIADARTGLVTSARSPVHWMLGVDEAPPARTLLGDEPEGPALVERRGIYVEEWRPGPDGKRTGLLVAPSGRATVVADEARPEDRPFIGRQVIAKGVLVSAEPPLASDHLRDVVLTLKEGESAGDGRLPLVTTRAAVDEHAHQWIVIQGELVEFVPWSEGADVGVGRLELDDGRVLVTGPVTRSAGPLAAIARVGADDLGITVALFASCESVAVCRTTPLEGRGQ